MEEAEAEEAEAEEAEGEEEGQGNFHKYKTDTSGQGVHWNLFTWTDFLQRSVRSNMFT